jgi:hypothetical protein
MTGIFMTTLQHHFSKKAGPACRFLVTILLFVFILPLHSQGIFPGLSGQQLLDSLEYYYKPSATLSYTNTRNLMFTFLDNENDSVTCVYTGFKIYLDHTSTDPIQQALAAGINTEHTWPQSLGSTGNARSDLHHLFPVHVDVNAGRGNLPFDEIPDQLTDRWYRLNYQQSTIPTAFIEEYSEVQLNNRFEPREDHKGNIARAIFYFYTMYKDQSDTNFFHLQKEGLRTWHSYDPADADELLRTGYIAQYQEEKPNPFIIDSTLVNRAYFSLVGIGKEDLPVVKKFRLLQNYPNPFNPATTIEFELTRPETISLTVYSLSGQKIRTLISGNYLPGMHRVQWNGGDERGSPVASGVYFYQLQLNGQQQAKKMFLIR